MKDKTYNLLVTDLVLLAGMQIANHLLQSRPDSFTTDLLLHQVKLKSVKQTTTTLVFAIPFSCDNHFQGK